MRKKLTAFLCSPYNDLRQERSAVLDALRQLQVDHESMEFFGARVETPLEVCLQQVRASDIIIVIIGHRYGTVVPDLGISFAEAEYNEAIRFKKPCLVYLRDDSAPILPSQYEHDPASMPKLDAFKTALSNRHTVATFTDAAHLAVRIAADLSRTLQGLERSATQIDPEPDSNALLSKAVSMWKDALASGAHADLLFSAVQRAITISSDRSNPRFRVALSFAAGDHRPVRRFAQLLERFGVVVTLDEGGSRLGASPRHAGDVATEPQECVALFVSRAFLESEWSDRALDVAIERRLRQRTRSAIVPVLLENVDVPPILRDVRYLDMRNGDATGAVRRLMESLLTETWLIGEEDGVWSLHRPIGYLDHVVRTPVGDTAVRGWALDPDTTGPITVRFDVNGSQAGSVVANVHRGDVGRQFPAHGSEHGFYFEAGVLQAEALVSVFALKAGYADTLIGKRFVSAEL